jgi:hypothetical protein
MPHRMGRRRPEGRAEMRGKVYPMDGFSFVPDQGCVERNVANSGMMRAIT